MYLKSTGCAASKNIYSIVMTSWFPHFSTHEKLLQPLRTNDKIDRTIALLHWEAASIFSTAGNRQQPKNLCTQKPKTHSLFLFLSLSPVFSPAELIISIDVCFGAIRGLLMHRQHAVQFVLRPPKQINREPLIGGYRVTAGRHTLHRAFSKQH